MTFFVFWLIFIYCLFIYLFDLSWIEIKQEKYQSCPRQTKRFPNSLLFTEDGCVCYFWPARGLRALVLVGPAGPPTALIHDSLLPVCPPPADQSYRFICPCHHAHVASSAPAWCPASEPPSPDPESTLCVIVCVHEIISGWMMHFRKRFAMIAILMMMYCYRCIFIS